MKSKLRSCLHGDIVSEAGPGRQASVTDICHAMPCHACLHAQSGRRCSNRSGFCSHVKGCVDRLHPCTSLETSIFTWEQCRFDLRKHPAHVAWTRVTLTFSGRLAPFSSVQSVPWHAHPPAALAQVSAGSTRRHAIRTRPTGVRGDHVGGPGNPHRHPSCNGIGATCPVRCHANAPSLGDQGGDAVMPHPDWLPIGGTSPRGKQDPLNLQSHDCPLSSVLTRPSGSSLRQA